MTEKKEKIIATNRKARRNYQIFETYEAGVSLRGDEVKSLRNSACSIEEGFARIENNEVIIYQMHIPEFTKSSYFKSEPKRPRKLLLHKKQIARLWGLTAQKGHTLIPLKVYFNQKGIAKIQLAVARGKKLYDKRRKLKEEYQRREVQHQMKQQKKR